MKTYNTIRKKAKQEIVINRSRFIGRAFPVVDEDDALLQIEQIRGDFPDASHHCYAYVIGHGSNIQRFNDDGEPGGTAGMPILQVIQKQEIEDVLVVVTRYFGGTKLGAGGLVRAYSKSTAEVLEKAEKAQMTLSNQGTLVIDYALWGTLEYFLHEKGIPILDVDYMEKVTATIMTWMSWESFCAMMIELSNGKAVCKHSRQVYHSWPNS
ncbi:MAG TPA: YigZ family protein [Clostridia bacterium]|nr:YigZ family protein [Clostridia bacterium]